MCRRQPAAAAATLPPPQGTYAKVKYGQHVDTGEAVAVKVLDKEALVRSGMVEQIKREITILKQVCVEAPPMPPMQCVLPACVYALPPSCAVGGEAGKQAGSFGRQGIKSTFGLNWPSPAPPPTPLLSHACQIRHPHIVNLIEVMSSRDKLFMVMELVTGGELFDRVVAEGPVKARRPTAPLPRQPVCWRCAALKVTEPPCAPLCTPCAPPVHPLCTPCAPPCTNVAMPHPVTERTAAAAAAAGGGGAPRVWAAAGRGGVLPPAGHLPPRPEAGECAAGLGCAALLLRSCCGPAAACPLPRPLPLPSAWFVMTRWHLQHPSSPPPPHPTHHTHTCPPVCRRLGEAVGLWAGLAAQPGGRQQRQPGRPAAHDLRHAQLRRPRGAGAPRLPGRPCRRLVAGCVLFGGVGRAVPTTPPTRQAAPAPVFAPTPPCARSSHGCCSFLQPLPPAHSFPPRPPPPHRGPSAGVVLYVMLAGCLPFEEDDLPALFRKVCAAAYAVPPWLSDDAVALLAAILNPAPEKRWARGGAEARSLLSAGHSHC